MVEWSKAQHWKCCEGATSPRVRIPLSPPFFLPKKWRTKQQGFSSRFYANKYIVRPGLDGDCEIVCTEFVKCVNEL